MLLDGPVVGACVEVLLGLFGLVALGTLEQLPYTSGYQARCRASVGRNPMSSLSVNARMVESRMLVMFQHFFFFCTSPLGRTVHRSTSRMCFTSVGDWIGMCGTALTCPTSCWWMMASTCSRKRRRTLRGTTRPSCKLQTSTLSGGGIWVVHRIAEGLSWAEVASEMISPLVAWLS